MPASTAPGSRAGRIRPILRLWHRAFGLTAALWLLLLALTGSAIAFYDELDRWLNADLRQVDVATTMTTSVEGALHTAGAALPGFVPRYIDLPNRPGESLSMLGSAPLRGETRAVQVFLHPADGSLLGWRQLEQVSLHPRHLMDTLYVIHTELLLHETGVWLIGLLALLWLVDHFAAVGLAVPRLAAAWEALLVRGRGLNLRRLYDLHRAPSLWLWPLTATLALTGWCLSWYVETRALAGLVSPVSSRLHEAFPDVAATLPAGTSIDATIATVRRQVDGDIDTVLVIPRKGAWGVRSFDARDVDDFGRLWTYVSMADGSLMGQRHDIGSSAADAFFAWQYPLHSGRAFGMTGKVLVALAGVGTAGLCITGVWLWWRRRR